MADETKAATKKARPTVAEALEVLKESGVFDLIRTGDLSQQERTEIVEREMAAFRELVGRSTTERTQEIADKKFTGGKKFRVSLPDGNCHPILTIAAESETDAVARYNEVCGIRHTEREHVCHPADSRAAKDTSRFEYKKGKKKAQETAEASYGPA